MPLPNAGGISPDERPIPIAPDISIDPHCQVKGCGALGICPHKMLSFLTLVERLAAIGEAMPLTPEDESELARLRTDR